MKYWLTFFLACFFFMSAHAQGQWSAVSPYGGVIRCGLSLGNDLLIGTESGIYKSTDGGLTYAPHSQSMPSGTIVSLVEDGNYLIACIFERGIYRSDDTGKTWSLVLAGRYQRQDGFGQSKIEKVGNTLVVRGYDNGDTLYLSNNHGDTWTRQFFNNSLFTNVYGRGNSLFTSNYNTLGAQEGLYRSDNLGQSWVPSFTGMPASTFIVHVIAFSDTLYALSKHMYRSVNGGQNWTQVTTDTLPGGINGYPFLPEWVGVSGRTIFGQTGGNALLKLASWTPGQSGWQSSNTGLPANGNTNTIFSHKGKTYLARLENFYQTSGPGQSWTIAPLEGVNAKPVKDLFAGDNTVLGTSTPFVLTGNFASAQWTPVNPGSILDDYDMFSIAKMGSNYVLGVNGAFGVLATYVSTNQGSSWTYAGIYDILPDAQFLPKNDTLVIYGSLGGDPTAFLANSSGAKITEFSSGLFGWSFDDEVPAMTTHKGDLYCVITSTTSGFSKIRKFDLPAANFWSTVNEKIDNAFFGATALVSQNDTLYLGMSNGGVKYSPDNGATWTDISGGLNGVVARQLYTFDGYIGMASTQGVYLLEPGKTTWKNISYNLPCGDIRKVQATPQFLWAISENGGAWRLVRNGNVAIDPKIQAVNFRVYPNPATDQLSLTFDADRPAAYKILDLAGKVVETGLLQMEKGTATLSLKQLPAGMYICQVSTGDQSFAAPFIKQ